MLTPRLSLAAGTVADLPPAAAVACAADAGYALAGVRLTDPRAQAPGVAAALRRAGLDLLDVEVVRLAPGGPTDEQRRTADAAARLGARHVLVTGEDPDPGSLRASLAALVELLAGSLTRPALEPMAFTAVPRLADAAAHAAAVPGCTVVPDPLHLHRAGDRPGAVAGVDPALIGYAQIGDVARPDLTPADLAHEARHARVPPGHGGLDLGAYLAALPLGRPLAVEVPSDELAGVEPWARAVLVREATSAVLAGRARERR